MLGSLAPALGGSALVSQFGNAAVGAGLGLIEDLGYADTSKHGYLLLNISA